MLNYNRSIRQSIQKTKRSQKNIHTASIILKPQDSYSDILYLPLRDAVNKRIQNQCQQGNGYKKALNRSVRLDKSPSVRNEKENRNDGGLDGSNKKPEYKLKILNDTQKRIQTDRKSLRKSIQKSMKTIRLKTDYQDLLQTRQKQASASKQVSYNQVSTKHTQQYSNKIIYISKSQMTKIHKQLKKMQDQNVWLKRQINFYCNDSNKIIENSVIKALRL